MEKRPHLFKTMISLRLARIKVNILVKKSFLKAMQTSIRLGISKFLRPIAWLARYNDLNGLHPFGNIG